MGAMDGKGSGGVLERMKETALCTARFAACMRGDKFFPSIEKPPPPARGAGEAHTGLRCGKQFFWNCFARDGNFAFGGRFGYSGGIGSGRFISDGVRPDPFVQG